LNQAADSIRILQVLVEQLEATFDNGSTAELLRLIAAPGVGAGVMQFALSEANPYLSDTVLLALIERYPEVTPWFFQFILESNSPLSELVLEHALSVLPAGVHDQLLAVQSLAPNTREQLRARIASVRKRLSRWEARRFVASWETGAWDSLLLFATADPDRLARLLPADGQWANLDLLLRVGEADTLERSDLLNVLLQAAVDGRSLRELSAAEVLLLESLAAEPGSAGIAAAQVLRSFDGRVSEEPLPLYWTELRLGSDAGSGKVPTHPEIGGDAALADLTRDENTSPGTEQLQLFPNPAGDWLAVRGISGEGLWQILDGRGIQVSTGKLSPALAIPVAELQPGVYALRIEPIGWPAQTQIFIKIP
jgi:hypothetical protein